MARENSGNRQRARRARRTPAVVGVLSVIAFAGAGVTARAGEECVPEWDSQSPVGAFDAISGAVRAMVYYNENGEEHLFIAGLIAAAVEGGFAESILRWDGQELTKVGQSIAGSPFPSGNALTLYEEDGASSVVFGGSFTTLDGIAVGNIARWDGNNWYPLGGGTDGRVTALAVFDDGSGEALYAAGPFSMAGGVPASAIAKWDGRSWSEVGGGFAAQPGFTPFPKALLPFVDDGGKPLLFAAGIYSAGGVVVRGLAKWDGVAWSLPTGWISGSFTQALHATQGPKGMKLYVGGSNLRAGNEIGQRILEWDGAEWRKLGQQGLSGNIGGIEEVTGIATFDDGTGRALFVGGYLTHADGIFVEHIAKWDGKEWHPLGGGLTGSQTFAQAFVEDRFIADRPALLIGGQFTHAGSYEMHSLARWLTCYAPCPADLSGDREINTDDLNILLSGFGCTGDPGSCPGDIDEDGDTDTTDLNIILSVFGTSCPN